jgi:hypothetical protein
MGTEDEAPELVDDNPELDGVHPRVSDTLFEAFPTEPAIGAVMHPDDGLPVDVTPDVGDDAAAPSLSPENLVCMAQPASEDGQYPAVARCKFYKRQKVRDTEIQLWVFQRWCTCPALRGTNGAALDLRDTAVPACEMRDPPDLRSTNILDEFDDEKIAQGKDRRYFRVFKNDQDILDHNTHVKDP